MNSEIKVVFWLFMENKEGVGEGAAAEATKNNNKKQTERPLRKTYKLVSVEDSDMPLQKKIINKKATTISMNLLSRISRLPSSSAI